MKSLLFSSIPTGVLLLAGVMMFLSCQEPARPEPYPNSDLILEKLDASCTEAWLKVFLTRVDSPATQSIPILLTRDGEAVQSFAFTPPETLVVDEGLEPAHSYQYQAQRRSVHDNKVIASSNTLTVTTLDTTSHDFTWTIDTLGEYGSYFNDVAIIDENNIWAVGMIRTDSADYNAAHWDGERWELIRVQPAGYGFGAINTVFPFSNDKIWMASSIGLLWDGNNFTGYGVVNGWPYGVGYINAIWGSSPEDVWFVGSGGSIVHYDGSGFTRMESGTDIGLRDIYGIATDKIWCVGYDDENGQAILLEYDGDTWRTKYEYGQSGSEPINGTVWNTVWSSNHNLYLPTVNGLWQENFATKRGHFTNWHSILYNYYQIVKLQGNEDNDIMFVSNWSECFHFNGVNWRYYTELNNTVDSAFPRSLDFKGNKTAIVGRTGSDSRAFVMRGKR